MNRKHDKEMMRLNELMKSGLNACEMRIAKSHSRDVFAVAVVCARGICDGIYGVCATRARPFSIITFFGEEKKKTAKRARPLNCNDDMMTILYTRLGSWMIMIIVHCFRFVSEKRTKTFDGELRAARWHHPHRTFAVMFVDCGTNANVSFQFILV